MDMGNIKVLRNTMKKFNWSAIKISTTTVHWKDQTTLVGRPIKSVMPSFIFLVAASRRRDSSARGMGPIYSNPLWPGLEESYSYQDIIEIRNIHKILTEIKNSRV